MDKSGAGSSLRSLNSMDKTLQNFSKVNQAKMDYYQNNKWYTNFCFLRQAHKKKPQKPKWPQSKQKDKGLYIKNCSPQSVVAATQKFLGKCRAAGPGSEQPVLSTSPVTLNCGKENAIKPRQSQMSCSADKFFVWRTQAELFNNIIKNLCKRI